MTPKRFMLIAGETSGDILAAELVKELRTGIERRSTYSANVQPLLSDLAPHFFGAGGPRMAEAGVELALDMTRHSVTGLPSLGEYFKFRRMLRQLVDLACERQPHAIISVDFQLFNSIFATAIKKRVRSRRGTFNNWNPKLIKYISPQVWASREHRAQSVARDFDLLLSIIPFEKDWYASRVPRLPVEFVGHPIIDRNVGLISGPQATSTDPLLVLLPGSRNGELRRHIPVMLDALNRIRSEVPGLRARMVLPAPHLLELAKSFSPPDGLEVVCGNLPETLQAAAAAIASTGTVTLECAYFHVPTVTLYKTSEITWQIGKRLVKVKWLTMPNILANEPIFPEFLQHDATPENLARAALELLRDQNRRDIIQRKLAKIVASLGQPGASRRAAETILEVVG